jgi:translation initiation factor 4A
MFNEKVSATRGGEEDNNNNEDDFDSSFEFKSWDELEINTDLLRGIYAYGFEKPSPIQQKAIKPIISGRDIIAQAQSGTGKTATFTIGALQLIDLTNNNPQILVLSPTRELACQTAQVMEGIGSMMNGLRVQTLFGGSSYEESSGFSNKKGPHVICGCTGRIYDMMRRDKIACKEIKLVILDEADEMLSAGFKDQVYNIFQFLRSEIQVALFSATLPSHINQIIAKIMRKPVRISVKAEMLTLEGISQFFVAIEDDRQKYLTLKHLFSFVSVSQCIIYCNSIKRVSDLYDAMCEDEFPVCCIHSGMDKVARNTAFNEFKTGKSRVLISSNVTARGIDIQQVGIVINFDLPKCVHNYLHRIGRSGRWGRKGVGINLISRRDVGKLKDIEGHYSCEIKELPANLDFLQTFN